MVIEHYDSVWDAIEDTPQASMHMKLRSQLLAGLVNHIKGWGVTREEAAYRLAMSPSRTDDLMDGRISRFNLDTLINLAVVAGCELSLTVTAKDT